MYHGGFEVAGIDFQQRKIVMGGSGAVCLFKLLVSLGMISPMIVNHRESCLQACRVTLALQTPRSFCERFLLTSVFHQCPRKIVGQLYVGGRILDTALVTCD